MPGVHQKHQTEGLSSLVTYTIVRTCNLPMTIHSPSLNVNSDLRYHLDRKYAPPGITPASKMPSKKRTAHACARLRTKAVAMEQIPKPSVVAGKNQPGPMILQRIVAGISKIMYEM